MLIYYTIFLIIACFAYGEFLLDIKFNQNIKIVFSILIFCFLAFRYNVGNDFAEYKNAVHQIVIHNKTSYFEIGFVTLSKLLRFPQLVIAAYAFISITFIALANDSKKFFTSFLIYYSLFFIPFNIHMIRQGVAISIFAYSVKFLKDKNSLKFILLNLIGFLFHRTSIVAFIFLLLYKLKYFYQYIIIFIGCIAFFSFDSLKPLIFEFIRGIPYLEHYGKVYDNFRWSSMYGLSIGIFLDLMIFCFATFNKDLNFSKKTRSLLAGAMLINLFFNFSAILLRLVYYFRIGIIFFFAEIQLQLKNRYFKQFIFYVLLVYCLGNLYKSLNSGKAHVKYKTIFTSTNL